jgi:carboxymethylenebutenolidase
MSILLRSGALALLGFAALSSLDGCRSEPKKKAVAPRLSAESARVAPASAQPEPASASPPVPAAPPKPIDVTFASRGRMLNGTITRPAGAGPFPAFIYNHGSERTPGHFVSLRTFFASHGYVFFLPYRTGHEPSPGPFIGDQIKHASDRQAAPPRLLAEQADDVGNAMKFLVTQPYVNKDKVTVGGCSFGGIETIFSAERGFGFKAAVDWSGDAESWKNQTMRQRLLKAVGHAKIPIFFLQAENDVSTEPTRVFGAEAERLKKPHKAKVFPAYGDPSSHEDGHAGFCVRGSAAWGEDVIQFLDKYTK